MKKVRMNEDPTKGTRFTIDTPEEALKQDISLPVGGQTPARPHIIGGNVSPPLVREKSPDPVPAREERAKYPPFNEHLGEDNL